MLTDTAQWTVALCLGVAFVFLSSWSKFDEPSYDTQTEALTAYKPRFTTYKTSYAHAKLIYVSTFLALLFAFSFVPDLFFAVFPQSRAQGNSPSILPAVFAFGLIAATKVAPAKDWERKLRMFTHGIANIPEGVRNTIAQIRSSQYQPSDVDIDAQTAKLDIANGGGRLDRNLVTSLMRDDVVTKLWYSTGALLASLSPDKRGAVDIDPSFFEEYRAEMTSIEDKHELLTKAVRHHIDEIASNPGLLRPNAGSDSDIVQKELETLRDRLYVFVACAVRSSVKTETESSNVLKQLGYIPTNPFHLKGNVRTTILMIIQFSVLGILVLSVFTSFSTSIFSDAVLTPLGSEWANALPVPTTISATYAWTWMTAIFYAAAILAAIGMREAKISQRKWFDLNADRRRPIENYVGPTLIGTAVGSATLVMIAYVDGPGFQFTLPGLSELQEGVRQSLPWFPLAGAMSFISLWLVDADLKVLDRRVLVMSLAGGCIMAMIGLVTAVISMKTTVQAFAGVHQLTMTDMVQAAMLKVSVFIAFQIGLITTLLCAVVQMSQFLISKAQSLCGSSLTVATFRGVLCTILLDRGGSARYLPQGGGCANASRSPREGRWMSFPEGIVVRWNDPGAGGGDPTVGIFACSEGNLVYEEYAGEIAGDPTIVGHLDRRTVYQPSSVDWKDILANPRHGY